jgi:hypothetical protein
VSSLLRAARFPLLLGTLALLHFPLLRLPYHWDEAGYYIPAARDLLLTGSLVPHTAISNAHPPLVMLWLALLWKTCGFSPLVTRLAMLAVAAFALTGLFRLAIRVANHTVAMAATGLTALYPVFFMQSSLAHLDMAAAGLTFWALHAYLEDRRFRTWAWFALAALAKETAVLAPFALAAWELAGPLLPRGNGERWLLYPKRSSGRLLALFASALPLACWFVYHYQHTGVVFGNPEFFRYNVSSTLDPLRILLAFGIRLWQSTGYLHLFFLTAAMLLAMRLPPLADDAGERPRIALPLQASFAVVMLAYVLALSLIGGAELARYLLPIVPLGIVISVSTVWRRVHAWRSVLIFVAAMFVLGWFWNPPYGFPFEDNLAYRDYAQLHQHAAEFLSHHPPRVAVLTAWTASDELMRPFLGYVSRPVPVVRIENFSAEELVAAAGSGVPYDLAVIFSTKHEPAFNVGNFPLWLRLRTRFFGYHRDLPPAAAAQVLGGRIVMLEARGSQWIAVLAIERATVVGNKRNTREQSALSPSSAISRGSRFTPPADDTNVFSAPATPRVQPAIAARRVPPA